jgi:hypothetical protein
VEGEQAPEAGGAALARGDAVAREQGDGLAGAIVGDGAEGLDPAAEQRPGDRGRPAAVEARHRRVVRAGDLGQRAGLGGGERARGGHRFDADDPSAGEAADHRGRERPDADLDRHDVRPHVDLRPDRGVALDHPGRHRLVAGPGGVLDHQAVGTRERCRLLDGVVVGAVDDLHPRSLARDRGPPCLDHR